MARPQTAPIALVAQIIAILIVVEDVEVAAKQVVSGVLIRAIKL